MTIFQQIEAAAKAKGINYCNEGDRIGVELSNLIYYWFMDCGTAGVLFRHRYSQRTGHTRRGNICQAYQILERKLGIKV